ncbi:MAG: DUF58 domain-containing protein [Candidatus Coatesbacteria bacterium]|nr:MAG: DUF58 domain-containing protein [Candidatus Coatesbacteria bacterium]
MERSGRLSEKYLDPLTITAIESLELRARLVVEGFFAGLHRSPFKGFSVEFSEYRSYQPGDDPRYVDWRAWARSGRYYVKEFEEETNLRLYLVLDSSASMGFPEPSAGAVTKYDYAATLAAALAYLALHQRDAVGLITFGEAVRTVIPPRSSKQHLKAVLSGLAASEPGGDTGIFPVLGQIAERVRRRALVAMFTDLWDETGRVIDGLKALRGKKHDIIVFHILDPAEVEFPFREQAVFVDMESDEELRLDAARVRRSYREALERFRREFRVGTADRHIAYAPVTTDTPPAQALVGYLGARSALM